MIRWLGGIIMRRHGASEGQGGGGGSGSGGGGSLTPLGIQVMFAPGVYINNDVSVSRQWMAAPGVYFN